MWRKGRGKTNQKQNTLCHGRTDFARTATQDGATLPKSSRGFFIRALPVGWCAHGTHYFTPQPSEAVRSIVLSTRGVTTINAKNISKTKRVKNITQVLSQLHVT